jgi:hypothetical protein
MPFTVSPSSYQGGNFLFSGLSSAGQGIGEAIQKAQEQSKLESYNDSIVQHAYQSGQLDLEDLTKYRQMGHTQKTGYAASLAANFAEDMKRQQLAAAQEERAAQAQLRQQQAAAFNFTPPSDAFASAEATGNKLIQTGPGKYTLTPYGGGGQDEVQTDPLKVGGKVIPGIGVNRKTGQYVYFPQDIGGGVKIEVEPRTGVPFYRDLKGNPKPLTGQQIMSGQMLPADPSTQAPAPSPTPPPDGNSGPSIDDIMGMIGSPRPAPAAAAVANTTGNDVKQGKKLDQATAIEFLRQAGGDKAKARQLAAAAGYTF